MVEPGTHTEIEGSFSRTISHTFHSSVAGLKDRCLLAVFFVNRRSEVRFLSPAPSFFLSFQCSRGKYAAPKYTVRTSTVVKLWSDGVRRPASMWSKADVNRDEHASSHFITFKLLPETERTAPTIIRKVAFHSRYVAEPVTMLTIHPFGAISARRTGAIGSDSLLHRPD